MPATDLNLAKVLFVEDSLGDIALTKAILRSKNIHCDLEVVRDGEATLETLRSGTSTNRLPDLVLLDFNIPKMNGIQVLAELRTDKRLSSIPVVMLSGSDATNDIEMATHMGAVGYMIKPISEDALTETIESVASLAFKTVDENKYLCVAEKRDASV